MATIGLEDPEIAAVRELVDDLAAAAESAAADWERVLDPSKAELTIELVSRQPRAEIVRQALLAVDDAWRLANAVFDAPIDAPWSGLQGLIDTSPGLSILDATQGSLWLRMRDEFRRSPIATLAALVVIAGFLSDKIDIRVDLGGAPKQHTIQAPSLSEETRQVLAERIRLPDGCSVTIEVRGESADGALSVVRVRPAPHLPGRPTRELPVQTSLPESIPLDMPLPDGGFWMVMFPTGSGLPVVLDVEQGARRPVRHLIWQVQTHLANLSSASYQNDVAVVYIRTKAETDTDMLHTWLLERGARTAEPDAVHKLRSLGAIPGAAMGR